MAFRLHLLFVTVALCLLSLHHADAFRRFNWPKEPEIVGFSWKNCGSGTDSVQIKSLTVAPDPLVVPGNITVSTSFSIATASPTDLTVSITMEKKIAGFYIKVPCVDNVGSCTYGNICADWATACPKYFEKYGLPCTCPIPANTYSVPDAVAEISGSVPSIAKGDLRVSASINSASAGQLGCLQIEINLQ